MSSRIATWIGSIAFGALAFGSSACVIRESPGVNRGYGYGYATAGTQGGIMVGTPSPYYVNSMPPEPLYETMTTSPGYGYVWIDGYWNWNGYEWVWANGRWVTEQSGYVYVQPYYDWDDSGRNVYYPGHWSRPEHVDSRVRVVDHRDGRPTTGYYPAPDRDRPRTVDHRGNDGGSWGGGSGTGNTVPPPRDHDHRTGTGTSGGDTTPPPPPPRDHDHRTTGSGGSSTSNDVPPPPRTHRTNDTEPQRPAPRTDTSDHRSSGRGTGQTQPQKPAPRRDTSQHRDSNDHRSSPPSHHSDPQKPATHAPQQSPHRDSHDHRHSSLDMAKGTRVAMAQGTELDMGVGTTLRLK